LYRENFAKRFRTKFREISRNYTKFRLNLFREISRNLAKFRDIGKKFRLISCFAKRGKPNFVAMLRMGGGGAGACRAVGLCGALGQVRILTKLMRHAVTRGGLECKPRLLSARYISLYWGACDGRADGDYSLGRRGKYMPPCPPPSWRIACHPP
jgi:hypothetical protein